MTVHSAIKPRGGSDDCFGEGFCTVSEVVSATPVFWRLTDFYCNGKGCYPGFYRRMISSASKLPPAQHKPYTRRQSVVLVLICTFFGAAAQVLMKIGGSKLHGFEPMRILLNAPLVAGYAFYGLNTVMLMMALRDGELSKLYPVIALTYVWVNVLSMFIFHEVLNPWKVSGILAIMLGVGVLGQATAASADHS